MSDEAGFLCSVGNMAKSLSAAIMCVFLLVQQMVPIDSLTLLVEMETAPGFAT